jgi:hypothetical protein
MTLEIPREEWSPDDIDFILFDTAFKIKNGELPFRKELIKSPLRWKALTLARHRASLALTRTPFWGYNVDHVRGWLEKDPDNNPLLSEEIDSIISSRLVLPHPRRYPNLKVVSNFNPDVKDWLGVYMDDPEVLKWYEPSINFVAMRIHDYLKKNPGKTAGLTTGKWRFLHAAHLDTLWQMRQQCDFMIVAIDPKKHDAARVTDGFVPEYEDKVSFLRAITFPDGRKIDLMFETHFEDPKTWFSDLYLPFVLTESLISRGGKKEDLEAFMRTFSNPHKYFLEQARANLDSHEAERRSRLFYFVSEVDPFFDHKQLLASREGYEVKTLSFQEWKTHVSASKIVERFGLEN